jgi:hypothetical protein
VSSPAGKARYARSSKTRRLYRALVRKASQERLASARSTRVIESRFSRFQTMGRMTLNTSIRPEAEEFLTDTEELSEPIAIPAKTRPSAPAHTPNLGFRVWDAKSKTLFTSEEGFVSEAFSIWKGPYPPPFSSESADGKLAINLLCNLHFSMTSGGASAWISVSTSLLQALVKACSMERPRIALIDLDHATLRAPNKTLYAAEVCTRFITSQVICLRKSDPGNS